MKKKKYIHNNNTYAYFQSLGIGPVRALDLIKKHRSIEGILETLDKSKYQIPDEFRCVVGGFVPHIVCIFYFYTQYYMNYEKKSFHVHFDYI